MADNENRTNAARRLYVILKLMKTAQPRNLMSDVVRSVFSLAPDDLAGLYQHYGSFLSLILDVETRLNALDDPNREQYLISMKTIIAAVSEFSLQHSPDHIFNKITDAHIALLAFAAQGLDRIQTEILLPAAKISSLQTEVANLFQKVAGSDLDPELRIIILDLLEAIKRTLSEYQIRGAEGLKRVLAECFGRMSLDKELVVRQKDRPEMKSFFDLLSRVNGLFTAATNADKIGKFLGDSFLKMIQ